MSLITRIGASNADSYVSLIQAETILADLFTATERAEWTALTIPQKEYRLKLAAKAIGLLPLRGRRVYRKQALDFPRTRLVPNIDTTSAYLTEYIVGTLRNYSADQVLYRWAEDKWIPEELCRKIPIEVKEVQCEIAFSVIHRALTDEGSSLGQYPGAVKNVSIGPLSIGFGHGESGGNVFDKIWRSSQFTIFIKMKKWISQFRGGAVRATQDVDFWETCTTLPTTTTTTTSSSTSSSSVSTTTSSSTTSSSVSTTTSSSSTTTTAAP